MRVPGFASCPPRMCPMAGMPACSSKNRKKRSSALTCSISGATANRLRRMTSWNGVTMRYGKAKQVPFANYVPYTHHTGRVLESLAEQEFTKTLAIMHGSSYYGNGAQALRDLAT